MWVFLFSALDHLGAIPGLVSHSLTSQGTVQRAPSETLLHFVSIFLRNNGKRQEHKFAPSSFLYEKNIKISKTPL